MLLRFYLLTLACAGGALLAGHARRDGTLARRAATLVVLLHLVVLALAAGRAGGVALALLVLVAGAVEVSRHYGASPAGPAALGAAVLAALVLRGALLPWAVPLTVGVAAYLVWGRAERVRSRPMLYLFAALFLGVGAGALALLGAAHPGGIVSLILLLQLNEATGYLVGRRFGRRRPFPRISPGKSVEGYLAGAAAAALGIVLLHTAVPVFGPFRAGAMLALWGVIVGVGNAGDLLVSALKRKLEIKDMSGLLPGHGGMLDRCDSLLFAAPVLALLWGRLPTL